jgi:hypothetical protein
MQAVPEVMREATRMVTAPEDLRPDVFVLDWVAAALQMVKTRILRGF